MDFFTVARHARSQNEPNSLIAFYEGSGTDGRGRQLSDILQWGWNKLESSHDYIQTLFPLPERSSVNDRAPTIDRQVFEAFRARKGLRDSLREAFQKMLWFYGFELGTNEEDGKVVVQKGHNYDFHSQNWLTRFDHNHLRITRIIRSLRVLGLEEEALAFYNSISAEKIVSARSRMYWERAARRPLNITPDVDDEDIDEERMGPKFLREYENWKRDRGREQESFVNLGKGAKIQAEPDVEKCLVGVSREPNSIDVRSGQEIDNSGPTIENEDFMGVRKEQRQEVEARMSLGETGPQTPVSEPES